MRVGVVVSCVLFLSGVTVGVVLTGRLHTKSVSDAAPVTGQQATPATAARTARVSPIPSLAGAYPDFTLVAEATVPAVANISSRQVARRRTPFGDDPFFGRFFGNSPFVERNRERPSLGSGVIVSTDGLILTNAHVVGQTSGITVSLADNREFEAELIGRDESTDIALLRVDADDLPTVPWGDSSSLRVAEWVLAVGNPFQLNQTVTLGIVSAVGRDNLGVAQYEDFIQTDAAINPGNSGGALVNGRGELIGINTAILSGNGGYQGVGFAVPSNLASRVMEDLLDDGEVQRGSFGYVDVRNITPRIARQLGLVDTRGVVVTRIHQASAAARAGIEPGDVIISFDGTTVEHASDFARLLSDAPIGSVVTLGAVRAGRGRSFAVTVSASAPR